MAKGPGTLSARAPIVCLTAPARPGALTLPHLERIVDRRTVVVETARMLTAALGLIGVLVGAFVSQRLSASWQRRRERLEALVALVAACARVIGAHERLHDLIVVDSSSAATERIQEALLE